MRDILVFLIVFGSLPFILRRPHIGILVWCWLSYMNPHRLAFGWARYFSFAEVVAVVTLFSIIVSKEGWRIPLTPLTVVWVTFIAWMGLTTYYALIPELAQDQYIKIVKIQFTTFLTIMVMNTKQRLNLLLAVIVFSIAFFGIKGGIYTLVRGGGNRVWGPPGGFIEDNNSLALALLMILPLMYYLRSQLTKVWHQRAVFAAMLLCGLASLGTYSRGAAIAGAAMVLFFLLKSDKKLPAAIGILLVVPPLVLFMPGQWGERVGTIFQDAKHSPQEWSEITGLSPPIESRDYLHYWPTDTSAAGRINAWNYAIHVANARVTGAGLESWKEGPFDLYAPIPEDQHSAHSIYFSVLADHGWFGLVCFVLIGLLMWRNANWVSRHCDKIPELKWLSLLCRMMQVGTIAYASGGAFLSLSYFDLYWHFVGISLIARRIVEQHLEKQQQQADQTRSEKFGRVSLSLPETQVTRPGS
jgi:putative inorganic carbon (hco3(-)) transporter